MAAQLQIKNFPPELLTQLKATAAMQGVSLSKFVIEHLKHAIAVKRVEITHSGKYPTIQWGKK